MQGRIQERDLIRICPMRDGGRTDKECAVECRISCIDLQVECSRQKSYAEEKKRYLRALIM